jgi:hypothetical protein
MTASASPGRFNVGQKVRAIVSAQELIAGRVYVVVQVKTRPGVFSSFVTYWLRPEGGGQTEAVRVINAHLLLAVVKP